MQIFACFVVLAESFVGIGLKSVYYQCLTKIFLWKHSLEIIYKHVLCNVRCINVTLDFRYVMTQRHKK